MRLSVSHTTRYSFSDPITYGVQRLRLKPKLTHGQAVFDWTMELDGAVTQVEYDDQHQNATTLVSVLPGTRELTIRCSGTIETVGTAGVVGPHNGHMPLWCFLRQTELTEPGPKLEKLVAGLEIERGRTLAALHALSGAVLDAVAYQTGTTDARTTAEAALAAGKGVCQDHAHILIGAGRLLGIPMRYVSGYLKLDDTDEQQAGHGWAEGYVERLGWVGFDVSNAICPDERYVRVATGRDYGEAAPITGVAQGTGETRLEVEVVVEQDRSAGPSATKSAGQAAIQASGQSVQAQQQRTGEPHP